MPVRVEPLDAAGEPKRDISRDNMVLLVAWLVAILGVAAYFSRLGWLPLAAVAIATVPATGPTLKVAHLPLARYAATAVAAVNGSLLTFLASLMFATSMDRGVPISEPDLQWLIAVALAAVVSSVGAGVIVHRSHLAEAHHRWREDQALAMVVRRAAGARAGARVGEHRPPRWRTVAWVIAGVVLMRRAGGE